MDFQLKKYYRNISDEEMIEDIKRVASILNKNTVTIEEYNKNGKYHGSTIGRRFGSWSKALQKAGLDVAIYVNARDANDEKLLNDLKRVAILLNKITVTHEEYCSNGRYHWSTFIKRFGSWNKAIELAGLDFTIARNTTDEELFQNILHVWEKLGRQPAYKEMHKPLSKYSGKPYVTRFGSWFSALGKFVEYINDSSSSDSEESAIKDDEFIEMNNNNKNIIDTPIKHKTKRDPNWRLRFLVMKRDGFKCIMCGKTPATTPGVELHIDHIHPWSKGGETILENLQTLCSVCNIGKSNLT